MAILIFVDCEGHGPAAGLNDASKFEVGAVEFKTRKTFHGIGATKEMFEGFEIWIKQFDGNPLFVSDNPAYDWQFVNYYFHLFLGRNPFGFSARRIGDFYAGVMGNFMDANKWKRFRKTVHDHHPVNDAMGNLEAFEKILSLIERK